MVFLTLISQPGYFHGEVQGIPGQVREWLEQDKIQWEIFITVLYPLIKKLSGQKSMVCLFLNGRQPQWRTTSTEDDLKNLKRHFLSNN